MYDSHEFLNLVISLITDEIDAIKNQINDQSLLFLHNIIDPTTNNFQFCLATERCCEICGMSTIKTEIHTALLIHVTDEEFKTTKTNSLSDLLENYFASESMDGCYCDKCQSNQRKYIKYSLERLPRIFIFYLKRWHITKNSNGELQSVSKEDHPIDCTLDINVYPFCSTNTLQPPMINYLEELPNLKDLLKQREERINTIEPKRAKLEETNSEKMDMYEEENVISTHANYRLFAVINHHGGSSDVGHYTSTVYDAKGDTWWTYDDTSVTSCTEQRVLNDLAPDAYGVMYMHKDILKLFQAVIDKSMQ
ncbi:unnamed protein product [Adineta steineri]|uniref:USP domain-containing protein n=1 Tax=Adineta steineri TaxID=433720 RepID=A0A814F5V7_9BILA|nr:unnamed protein product [Adineta steineri]CAF0995575.1 unnamed protein product [Adineta steineri]CAF1063001.1 unnamed protein product [Adineta steineri]CAF3604531.1 unnamed protein product [Adineta steineri]CAF3658129.1 unnamed protein product [Adineta steineri]